MNTSIPIRITLYRSAKEWCYAAWCHGEFDHSDPVGIPDESSEAGARNELLRQFPGAEIVRVGDVDKDGRAL